MLNKWSKGGPIMLAALLSVNFLAAQAQAGLITAKGAPAPPPDLSSVQGLELPDLPEPVLEQVREWINDLAMGKGCRGRGVVKGAVCSYDSLVPPPGQLIEELPGGLPPGTIGGFSVPAGSGPEGGNKVPVPGTVVLLGLGLASLGAARRRR